jgi:multiple sugar transport system substrate-binding protein
MTTRNKDFSRRKFLQLAGTGIAGAVLAACAPAATAPPEAPKPADTQAPVATQAPAATEAPAAATPVPTTAPPPAEAKASLEFVMNDSPGWADSVNKMMKMYMDAHPNVTVKFTPVDWGQLTVVLPPRFAAKEPPDLLLCDAFWPWVQQGLVLDLNPFIEKDKPDLSIIADKGAGLVLGNPARYGLPFDFTGSVIPFNKTHFDKYGIEHPKPGWTMDDFAAMAVKATRDKAGKSPLDSGFDPKNIAVYGTQLSNWTFFGALIKSWGGQPWSKDGKTCLFDEANALECFTFFNDLACKQHALMGPGGAPSGTDPFASAMCATSIEGEWQLALYKDIKDFDWDVAAWPNGKKENWQYGGSDALGIAKDSKYIDAAWDFEKYWIFDKPAALTTGIIMPPALNEAGLDPTILNGRMGTRGPTMDNLVWAYTNMRKYADCSLYYQSIHPEQWQPVLGDMLSSLLTLCNEPASTLVPKTAKQITEILQKPA